MGRHRVKDMLRRDALRRQKREAEIETRPEEIIRGIGEVMFGVTLTDAQVRTAQSRGGDMGAIKYALDTTC